MTDGPTYREVEGIWDRLRRRKVVQWGLAYAAAAWGFLQGLQYLATAFEWPIVILKLGAVVFAIGLPIALVLAWYHGDRGEQNVSRAELAIITLLFLLGGGLFWYFQRSASTPVPVVSRPSGVPVVRATTADDRSIAVLPFVNMSSDREQDYFSDGISEELLNLLTKVPELRVIARTSSFAFKGRDLDIAEIARRLNVAHVLEGSVRKSGDKVRITAQLVRAADSSHLWSETYDRRLGDVFAIQDEIAGGAAHIERALALDRGNLDVLDYAAALLSTLGRLDEEVALLAYSASRDPANPSRHNGLGVTYYYAGHWDESIASLRTATTLSPGLIGAHYTIGQALLMKGQAAAALAEMQLEPDEPSRLEGIALAEHSLGHPANSDAALDAVLAKYPQDQAGWVALVYAWRGETDRAFAFLDRAVADQEMLGWIAREPMFAPLHDDPRWLPLLRRLGRAPEQLAAIKFDVSAPQ